MTDVKGLVAVVTGASSGIGAALAQGLSGAGARVTLSARRPDRLEAVARNCPGETLTAPADMTDPAARRGLAVCPHLTNTEFFDVSAGAEDMAEEVKRYRTFMDSPEAVARGIIEKLDSDRLVVFPTDSPEKAYFKQRDI